MPDIVFGPWKEDLVCIDCNAIANWDEDFPCPRCGKGRSYQTYRY